MPVFGSQLETREDVESGEVYISYNSVVESMAPGVICFMSDVYIHLSGRVHVFKGGLSYQMHGFEQ
jgi:hypothetical protein